jgi:hypothetical protein
MTMTTISRVLRATPTLLLALAITSCSKSTPKSTPTT